MKREIFFIPLMSLIFYFLCIKSYAQLPPSPKSNNVVKKGKTDEGVEKLKSLGHNALVKMGLDILKKKGVEVYNYKVSVIANRRFLIVHFYHPIIYLPQNTIYAGSYRLVFSSNKFQKRISHPYKNPFNAYAEPGKIYPAYRQTSVSKQVIQHIVTNINRFHEGEGLKININTFRDALTVWEKNTYYKVELTIGREITDYKIDKSSGKVTQVNIKVLPPPPPFTHQDEYKEIKE